MGAAIVEMIPFALGKMIAVNPTIAVILLLVSANGGAKARAYVAGAFLGPLLAATLLLPLIDAVDAPQTSGDPSSLSSVLQLLGGLVFLVLALRSWHQRGQRGIETPTPPFWMRALDGIGVIGAFGLGAAMTVIGVKNLLMLAGMVVAIGQVGIGFGQREIVISAFVLISTVPVAAPLVADRLLGPRADSVLGTWKAWLVRNSDLVTLGLFLLLGGFFTYRGVVGLVGVVT